MLHKIKSHTQGVRSLCLIPATVAVFQTPILISASWDRSLKSTDTTSGEVLSSGEGRCNCVFAVLSHCLSMDFLVDRMVVPLYSLECGHRWSFGEEMRERAHDGCVVIRLAIFKSLLSQRRL
jgi:hypothetical protein